VAEPIGVSGVVAALSVASDLTRGHPPGEAMRACLLATALAREAGCDDADCRDVYYTALMRFAGCPATSHEIAARYGGDDVKVRAGGDLMDPSRPGEALRFLVGLGGVRMLSRAPGAPGFFTEGARADCEVGAQLTRRLRLPAEVSRGVLDGFERWDGKGAPNKRKGDEIAAPARYAAVAYAAVMFDAVGGVDAATDAVGRWSGRALDPDIASAFLAAPEELIRLSDPDDVWSAVVDAEPGTERTFASDEAFEEALSGFGDAGDLKSPWFQGHSSGVAELAARAAGLTSADETLVRRAGFVHDLGRVAVPTGIWERPGSLRHEEWELVRLHPYQSNRILARSPVLEPLARVAGRHHERTDGSGYPAGLRAAELDAAASVLAAADVLHALGEPRPHRPAFDLDGAARVIGELPLDRDAVRAVLEAAGGPAPELPPLPAGLTERELDVLRRLVVGKTKRQIAAELVISQSTVHTHTVHIYEKCDVSTRAGLAMFAMEHGLAGKID
jgi:HD-GYP domain-containing protein (c-di-GMP phosphodiesterase class II)